MAISNKLRIMRQRRIGVQLAACPLAKIECAIAHEG